MGTDNEISSVSHLAAEIKRRREAWGMTQFELSEKTGISRSVIAKLETEEVDARVGTLAPIAAFFGVPIEALLGMNSHAPNLLADPRLTRPEVVVMLDQRTPVGTDWPTGREYPSKEQREHIYQLVMEDDAMSPAINAGNKVWIDETQKADVGDVVVFGLAGAYRVMRLMRRDALWLLAPDNRQYHFVEIDPANVRIIGVVIEVLKGKP